MSASFSGARWGPGPGPGPGGGGGAALAALFSIAARHLIRSNALVKVCSRTTAAALSRDTAAALAAPARTRPLNTALHSLAPTLHRTLHSQSAHSTTPTHTALSIQSAALAHTAYRKLTTTSHDHNRAAAFHTARAFAQRPTRARLPINQTFQIHGPGLHLARNFSSAGAGSGGAGGASTAIQESVPLMFRMMIDDEEKNRRMRKAGGKKEYSIGAAVASRASAKSTPKNGGRTSVQNAISQHRQNRVLPPSPVSVPTNIEEEISSEEYDYFFIPLPTTAPATAEQQKAHDEQRRHILRIRSRLLENQGPQHAPGQISTVLTIPHEPVDRDWARLLMPPQRPSYDSQTRRRRLTARTVSVTGGFLNDVHRAAVDLEEEERRRAAEELEYDRPVRNFVRVLSLLRAVLDVDTLAHGGPISGTIQPGSPNTSSPTIPSRLIIMQGHAKADVIEGLHLMLDLHAESERLSWKEGEEEPTAREVEVVLDVLLRQCAVQEEEEQELVFRPTVLLGNGVQEDQGFGSPSLQFDFPLAPLSPRSAYTRPSSLSSSLDRMEQDGDQGEEAEVESLLGLTRSHPRSSLSLSSSSGSGSDLEMEMDMEIASEDGEDHDDQDGRWLYDSRTLMSDQQ